MLSVLEEPMPQSPPLPHPPFLCQLKSFSQFRSLNIKDQKLELGFSPQLRMGINMLLDSLYKFRFLSFVRDMETPRNVGQVFAQAGQVHWTLECL